MRNSSSLQSDVAEAFGLTNGSVVSMDLDRTPGQDVVTKISIEGNEFTLDLHPISIRTQDFVLRVQMDDGTFEDRKPGESRLLRGSIRELKGSRVVGSMLDAGLAAKITMDDKQVFFVEPLASRVKDQDLENMHIVYRADDTKRHDSKCGVEDNALGLELLQNPIEQKVRATRDDEKQGNGYPEGGGPLLQVAEIALDADFEYFTDYGSVPATTARMELIIGLVNDQYESDVGITHMISGVVIRSTPADPYTSTDSCVLLDQFQSEWINNQGSIQRDVAHLFTGKEIDDSTIGIAFIGAICSNTIGYGLAQSDFNGNLGCATDLTAHELGHNWDANHCSCPSHTMNPSITCSNVFNPIGTIPDITSFRDSLTCLDNGGGMPPANDDYFGPNLGLFPFNETGTNVDATTEVDEQQLENTGSTVWWFFVAPADGTVTIDTFGSDYDTQLHIYTGFAMGFPNLIPVANDDDTGGVQSQVAFAVTSGECYDVRVGGFQNGGPVAEGNIALNGTFEPGGGILLGDVNLDGFVNLLDVGPFVALLGSGGFQAEADIDGNGVVNLLDVEPFVDLLSGP